METLGEEKHVALKKHAHVCNQKETHIREYLVELYKCCSISAVQNERLRYNVGRVEIC